MRRAGDLWLSDLGWIFLATFLLRATCTIPNGAEVEDVLIQRFSRDGVRRRTVQLSRFLCYGEWSNMVGLGCGAGERVS